MSNETTQEQRVPTKEEIVSFIQEQIDVKSKQVELQELNTKLAVLRAEELKALSFIGNITNPKAQPEGTPHTITQEDLDNNPELAEEGIQVGDEVIIPSNPESLLTEQEKERKLKK